MESATARADRKALVEVRMFRLDITSRVRKLPMRPGMQMQGYRMRPVMN